MALLGFVRLCWALSGFVWLCRALLGFVWLCRALSGLAVFSRTAAVLLLRPQGVWEHTCWRYIASLDDIEGFISSQPHQLLWGFCRNKCIGINFTGVLPDYEKDASFRQLGSEVQRELKNTDDVRIYYLTEPPVFLKKLPRLLCYVSKVLFQCVSLGVTLLLNQKCGYILIQNPPSIPTIAVSVLVCLLCRSYLVIDWHNYGYTILGLTLGDQHPLVRFSRWYEYFLGKFSQDNICVTNAMKEDLSNKWKIKAHVMYDRPAAMFKETSLESNHDLFRRLLKDYPIFRPREKASEYCTVFTQRSNGGEIRYTKDRPALLDEDFDILLDALQDYDARKQKLNKDLPDLICVITGKGPLKEYYNQKIEYLHLKHVQFCLPWLSTEDYPLLLGCADLGVCLHKSSSGLDLPMKVVDMFGCGLPVCAIHFNCLPELVVHEENGIIFKDSRELCQHLQDLLQNLSFSQSKLKQMRQNLKSFQSKRWHDCWKETVLPLFIDSSSNKRD